MDLRNYNSKQHLPTPEELATLSRLTNELRALKFLKAAKKEEILAPVRNKLKEMERGINLHYQPTIDSIINKILELRASLILKRRSWQFEHDLKKDINIQR